MSNGYKINTNKSDKQRKLEKEKYAITRELIKSDILEQFKIKRTPILGPRTLFFHYIFDLNWKIEDAAKEILKQFPTLNLEIVEKWIKENKEKEEGKSKNNDGR